MSPQPEPRTREAEPTSLLDTILAEAVIVVVGPDAERVDICICWRFLGQRCVPGSRVDLRCHFCQHRVAADPSTVRFHDEKGARIVCHECLDRVEGLNEVL